ncbi:6-pyruvoyl tetrahydropterin synthase family protein [Helicobacter pylori]|nr:6-pyruvoyl tetrahydropterin synthase family protein [Helicobacter pylori]
MVIRRLYQFCASHVVRNCSSLKCAQNIHGHNYEVEVFIETNRLDSANMALDFGLMQQEIQIFIKSFDHAHHFWDKESDEFQRFIENHCVRYVKCSFNLSAESYALMFLYYLTRILQKSVFSNNEGELKISSVRVHETKNGYAESFLKDLENPHFKSLVHQNCVSFSQGIQNLWHDKDFFNKIISDEKQCFFHAKPLHQIP